MKNKIIISILAIVSLALLLMLVFLLVEPAQQSDVENVAEVVDVQDEVIEEEILIESDSGRRLQYFDALSVEYFRGGDAISSGPIIESHKFTFNEKVGEVLHVCGGQALQTLAGDLVCLGESSLVVVYENSFNAPANHFSTELKNTKRLWDVRFVEGSDMLLISFDHDPRRFMDGLYYSDYTITHAVSMGDMHKEWGVDQFRVLDVEIDRFSFAGMIWNPSGTKAVMMQRGAEGGGLPGFIAYDLSLDVASVLIDTDDPEDQSEYFYPRGGEPRIPGLEHINWIDDSTVEIFGIEFTF